MRKSTNFYKKNIKFISLLIVVIFVVQGKSINTIAITNNQSDQAAFQQTDFIDISSTGDLHLRPNEVLTASIEWFVTYGEIYISGTWSLWLNDQFQLIDALDNDSVYGFDLAVFNLDPGTHNFTFVIELRDFEGTIIIAESVVLVHISHQQPLPVGTSTIRLEGIPQVTINITVNASVEILLEPSSFPPSAGIPGLDILWAQENITTFNYFLGINLTDPTSLVDIWINISYLDWQDELQTYNLDETTLKIYFLNETTLLWEPYGTTGVDLDQKIIYAHADHLTHISTTAMPPPGQGVNLASSGSVSSSSSTGSSSGGGGLGSGTGVNFGFGLSTIIGMMILLPIYLRRRKN